MRVLGLFVIFGLFLSCHEEEDDFDYLTEGEFNQENFINSFEQIQSIGFQNIVFEHIYSSKGVLIKSIEHLSINGFRKALFEYEHYYNDNNAIFSSKIKQLTFDSELNGFLDDIFYDQGSLQYLGYTEWSAYYYYKPDGYIDLYTLNDLYKAGTFFNYDSHGRLIEKGMGHGALGKWPSGNGGSSTDRSVFIYNKEGLLEEITSDYISSHFVYDEKNKVIKVEFLYENNGDIITYTIERKDSSLTIFQNSILRKEFRFNSVGLLEVELYDYDEIVTYDTELNFLSLKDKLSLQQEEFSILYSINDEILTGEVLNANGAIVGTLNVNPGKQEYRDNTNALIRREDINYVVIEYVYFDPMGNERLSKITDKYNGNPYWFIEGEVADNNSALEYDLVAYLLVTNEILYRYFGWYLLID